MINWISISIFFSLIWSIQSKDNAIYRKLSTSCNNETMQVKLTIDQSQIKSIYLRNMLDFPDDNCKPHFNNDNSEVMFAFVLKSNYNKCGLVRIFHQKTGVITYRHEIHIEDKHNVKQVIPVKCILKPEKHVKSRFLTKRDVPFAISEDEEIEIVSNITKYAPEPIINANVRQDGKVIQNELKVAPGTPLQMEIFLDRDSSSIYGLLVKHMSVSDTRFQDETLILNGCAIDPFLFDNFKTNDGDFLSAKFKAFKFPETSYVMFFITVNVCLDKCQVVECSDGNVGYGKRKRREIAPSINDPNKIFEISFTSFIKINYDHKSSNPSTKHANKSTDLALRDKLIYGQHNIEKAMNDFNPKTAKLSDDIDNHHPSSALQLTSLIPFSFLIMFPILYP